MADEKKPVNVPEKFHGFMNRLMGVKRRVDPRKVDGPVYATFQDRLFASALDVGCIFIMFHDLFTWISSTIYQGIDQEAVAEFPVELEQAPFREQATFMVEQLFNSGAVDLWLLNSFIQSVILGVIFVAVWTHFNTTPGKYLIGIRFAGKNGEGMPDMRQYIKRYLGFYLSMPIFMIGFATLGFDKQKRAWHDRIAGTTVIYTKEGSIFRRAWDLFKAQFKKKKDD